MCLVVAGGKEWLVYMTNKGLCLRYRKDIFITLSMIFNYGEKYYDIDNRSVKKEGNFKEQERKKEMQFWTYEEFKKFDSVIDDLEYKVFLIFCITQDADVEKHKLLIGTISYQDIKLWKSTKMFLIK